MRSSARAVAGSADAARDDVGGKISFQVVVFVATDLTAESSFWAGVLGGTVDADDDWHMVSVDGQPRVGVQLAGSRDR